MSGSLPAYLSSESSNNQIVVLNEILDALEAQADKVGKLIFTQNYDKQIMEALRAKAGEADKMEAQISELKEIIWSLKRQVSDLELDLKDAKDKNDTLVCRIEALKECHDGYR
ncbi:hypothetical protein ACHAPU_011400 [Fusarium lateritium]